MQFIYENKICKKLVNSFDEEMKLKLAKRLEENEYNSSFDGLKDFQLLRAFAIIRYELITTYNHLSPQLGTFR